MSSGAPDFKYPRDLVARLRSEWHQYGWRGVEVEPLPPDEILIPLVETCYFASFTLEEGRRTTFRLFVGDPSTASREPFRFGTSVPVTVQALRRLAPATQGQMLGITLGPSFAECTIWGFCDGASSTGVTIEVSGPGHIGAGNGLMVWRSLQGGSFADDEREGWGRFADEAFEASFEEFMKHVEDPVNRPLYRTPFGSWTGSLIHGMSDRGHGGAIFVIPEAEADGSWRAVARVKYPCDHRTILPLMVRFAKNEPETFFAFENVDAELRRVAALTQVDGAVIITDHFRVLGFGVEFTAPPTNVTGETVDHYGKPRPVEEFGTRHRSAFRFVSACPYVTAFVCSQDGGVRCVVNRDGRVRLFE